MYGVVPVTRRQLADYQPYVGEETIATLRSLAAPLKGTRVLNLSVSPFGTGVAEFLHSLVPLLRDLGLVADWQVVRGSPEFAGTARLMYEGLSGRRVDWTTAAAEVWRSYNEFNAQLFDREYDIVVVHDPQPAGLLLALAEQGRADRGGRWVWHCHLDLRQAQPEVWESLLPALYHYDATVFADAAFAPADLPARALTIIPPAIDPRSPRNMELAPEAVGELLAQYGLDVDRPIVVQVGHLDPAFDPQGAINVYRRAREERSDLQLLLVHPMAETTLESWAQFERVVRYASGDQDIHVLVGQQDVGLLIVNAAERGASVVMQRSVPAGFALPLFEAQWKGRPVVAGMAGGLPAQVIDGQTGYLAADEDQFVARLLALLQNPAQVRQMGAAGHELVRERYLLPRFLADELRLLAGLLASEPATPRGQVLPSA